VKRSFIKYLLLAGAVFYGSYYYFSGQSNYQSYQFTNNQLTIETSKGLIQLTSYQENSLEVLFKSPQERLFPSYAKSEDLKPKTLLLKESDGHLILSSERLTAKIDKQSLAIDYFFDDKPLTRQFQYDFTNKPVRLDFSLADQEKILGGGQRVLGMDRRGHKLPLYNRAHYGYTTHSDQMYYSLPVITSDKKFTLIFDNAAKGSLDIGHTLQNQMRFEAVSGRTAYLIMAENSYQGLTEQYVNLTGKQPLPPRWALGNFASRFGYKSEQEVREVVEKFIQADIPLDTVIIDLYWFGKDIKGHVGNLDWDYDTFPTPQKMIADLKEKGIKTILITEPFVLSTSKSWHEAEQKQVLAKNEAGEAYRYDFYFGNTGLIDVFDNKAQDWFWQKYQFLFDQGVAGTWGDLGEPEVHPDDILHQVSEMNQTVRGDALHNAYGHQWAKMVYEKQRQYQPEQRPLIMMRSGFVGSQRYGMIPWTGDVDRSWDGLKPQVELSLQMGLHGLAYTHSDLGGFAGGEVFDQQLYLRWLQFGVFQPVFRPHAQDHIAPEPVFHDEETQTIAREAIKLRYRLMPYIYSLAFENSLTGMPLMRPLFFDYEQDTDLNGRQNIIERTDSYLFGDAFLVHPITAPNQTSITIDLPSGIWFDFASDQRYAGGQIEYALNPQHIPVFVKAGAFIPMVKPLNNLENYSTDSLQLHYYFAEEIEVSEGHLYDDDGVSSDTIERKQYESLRFTAKHTQDGLLIQLTKDTSLMTDTRRQIELIIHDFDAPKKVRIIRLNSGSDRNEEEVKNYQYHPESRQLSIIFDWHQEVINLQIEK